MKKIRVFIVDDSAIVREILSQKLARDPRIEVVGTAMDPYVARNKLEKIDVDVITLDIEMPRMDGLTFLRHLMKQLPIPVVILSSLTKEKNQTALQALELGAVDVVPKPGGPFSVEDVIPYLIERILAASKVDMSKLQYIAQSVVSIHSKAGAKKTTGGIALRQSTAYLASIKTTRKLIAIGASTGGTVALEKIFKDWESHFPPTLVVIHMPERFTKSFAERLNTLTQAEVKEAENGDRLKTGTIYIAPGNYHMLLRTQGTERTIKISSGPKVCNQRPAVDPLFESVADQVGQNAIALLLTGMGKDGARGMLSLKKIGAHTIAQDETTSIVWGMPKEAIDLGAADVVLPLHEMASYVKKRIE